MKKLLAVIIAALFVFAATAAFAAVLGSKASTNVSWVVLLAGPTHSFDPIHYWRCHAFSQHTRAVFE